MFKVAGEKHREDVTKMLEYVSEFVDLDTQEARPGVTDEKLVQVLELMKKFVGAQKKAVSDLRALDSDKEELAKGVRKTRNHLRRMEEISGVPITDSILGSMYSL